MAKQASKASVARTTSEPSIREQLISLAVEYTTTEQITRLRDEVKALQGGKYQATFEVAQRCSGLAQFEEVTGQVKSHMKDAGQNIDRTFSNAVSAIKRYWKMCVKHEGMKVKVDKQGNTVVLRKSIKEVKTFNMLKSMAEGAKKALETSGNYGDATLTQKVSILQSKLKHSNTEAAMAAVDAALAFFLVGGEAKPDGRAKGEPRPKKAVRAKATRVAKEATVSKRA